VCRLAGARGALSSERAHVAGPLRRAVARDVGATLRTGDAAGLARVGAVAAGVTLASAGLVAGRMGPTRGRARTAAPAATEWLRFAIHDRIGVRVAADAPGAAQLREMLEPFATDGSVRDDLTVGGRIEPVAGLAETDAWRYGEHVLELPSRGLQVVAEHGAVRLNGAGELLVPALPLIDRALVRRDAAMVHAAAICRDGRAVCIAGAGGAGKTSAALRMAHGRGDGFMADDWCFIAADGRLLGYAKPLLVRPQHRGLVPGGGARRATPLAPAALSGALGTVATAVHPVVSRLPRTARVARRLWPEYRIVPARTALAGATIVDAAPLAATLFVERAACAAPELEARSAEWMADRLAGSFHSELPRGARELVVAMAGSGLMSLERAFAEKAAVLRAALDGRPSLLLRVPLAMRAPEAADAIAAAVDRALDADRR
jgi:hypothetical protein